MSQSEPQTDKPSQEPVQPKTEATFEEEVQAARISVHWGVAVAAAVAIVGLAGTTFLLRNQNDKQGVQYAEMVKMLEVSQDQFKEQQNKLQALVDLARKMQAENMNLLSVLNVLQAPELALMNLISDIKPTDPDKAVSRGRIFLDPKENVWQVFAVGLDKLPEDKTYQVWFVNDKNEKIAASPIAVNDKGAGYIGIDVPKEAGTVVGAIITDEPAAGSEKPTGTTWLSGKIKP